jgi:hypothetical protein
MSGVDQQGEGAPAALAGGHAATTTNPPGRFLAGPSRHFLSVAARLFLAVLMPVGPACVAVLRLVLAEGGPAEAVLWLGLPALFTLIPGAYAALSLARPYAPALTAWTAAFLIPGYLGMTTLVAGDAATVAAARIGLDAATTTRLTDEIMALTAVPVMVFVAGHIVGTVLLGVLAFRARLMPRWAAALMALSQPLHLVAHTLSAGWLDLLAWGMTALGMGFLALRSLTNPVGDGRVRS